MMREKTVLMVTHRLRGLSLVSTNQFTMDNGQIVGKVLTQGTFAEQGRYYQFKQGL